jgi:hypothetical protein
MDARQYADMIVDPTIAEFESNPRAVRRAFLACVVTFHMIDYITHPKGSSARRDEFRKASPAFATIDRVAHALKHVTTGTPSSPTLKPLAAGQVIERPPAAWDSGVWGLSQWGDEIGGVTITGEHDRDLLADVKEAAGFLRSKAAGDTTQS